MRGSLLLLLSVFSAEAQTLQPTVSNVLRYGNGEKGSGSSVRQFTYFENLTDVRLALSPAVVIGFRLLDDDPPEIGGSFQGIKRRYVEFRQDDVSLRAGNFSTLFGRGLVMNLFENRSLAYDSWIDGVKAKYNTKELNVTVLGGTIDFRDSITLARNERYKVRGANVEYGILRQLTVGSSFVGADGLIPQSLGSKSIKAEVQEYYAFAHMKEFDIFAGWARKWVNVLEERRTRAGTGLYSSVSFAGDGVGASLDYKNYRFDIRDPFARDGARPTRMLPFQNPPTVEREHTYTLLTRSLHQVDFNDEVGIQLEAFVAANDATTITFNTSLSSRHDYYDYDSKTFSFTARQREKNFLPSLDQPLSPYWELFAEVEHYFQEKSAFHVAVARRMGVQYADFTGPEFSEVARSTIIPLQLQYAVFGTYAVTLQSEHEWMFDNYKAQEKFYNHLLTVAVARSPDITIAFRYEITTNKKDPSARRFWSLTEVGYRIGRSHNFTVSYGPERGGLICSNGVCKYLQPFVGFRVGLQSHL